jgi:hypothetical protein
MKHYKHKTTGKLIGLENTTPSEDYVLLTTEEFNIIKNPPAAVLTITEVTAEVDRNRKKAYAERTDPLLNEARMKRLLGDDETADTLEIEALQLRLSIQTEYPYPETETN